MIAVIIAGGSGTRLWPLSTHSYPKHLLSVTPEAHSLLQQTYARVSSVADTIYIVTDASHAHHVQEQLPELDPVNIIVEPSRGGTANCMVAALVVIKNAGYDVSEPVFVLWADHYIRDVYGFTHSVKTAATIAQKESRITLIGIEPTHPAVGFGYIEKASIFDPANFVFNVASFREKPEFNTAKQYLRSGKYLWNCGYFIATLQTFEMSLHDKSPQLYKTYIALQQTASNEEFNELYAHLEPENIDNALIEKVDNLLVVPASFDWLDLGSYDDLHKVTERDECGNHVSGEGIYLDGVENSFIQNYESKPIAIVGLDNVVVINTKDGILVARKDLSKAIGEAGKQVQSDQA